MSKIKVIGVGNPLMGDDGVGIAAVVRLSTTALPEGVEVIDGGTGGITLLHLMEGARRVVFVDAVDMGRCPGSIVRFAGHEILDRGQPGFGGLGHATGLVEVLALGGELDILPEVTLFGVQVASVELYQGLSSAVEQALDRLAARVVEEVSNPPSRAKDL